MYGINSILIVVVLFAAILLANESGYRYARRPGRVADPGIKSQTNTIQAAMLGMLALLLGFSFTMSMQRFDSRSQAVIEEANAIGTAQLRLELLPQAEAQAIAPLLERYIQLRIDAGTAAVTDGERRRQDREEATALQVRIWRLAAQAAEKDPRPVTTGLFIQAFNEAIDAYGKRQAALDKHVPEVVLFLLFAVFIIAGSLLGYASGLEGRRPMLATLAITILIVMVIFIIIDLDRPRRGVIQVDQSSLQELRVPPEIAYQHQDSRG